MLPFLYHRMARVVALLNETTALWKRYNSRDLGVDNLLTEHLSRCEDEFKNLSLPQAENECASLKGLWTVALDGVDPFKREPVDARKRSMRRVAAFHVMEALSLRLREMHEQARTSLDGSRTQLQAILLAAFQSGWIDMSALDEPSTAQLEALWSDLRNRPTLASAARQVAMTCSVPDVMLLLQDVLQDQKAHAS